jgi:hypothetical protein
MGLFPIQIFSPYVSILFKPNEVMNKASDITSSTIAVDLRR